MKEIKKSKIIEFIRHLEKKYDVFLPVKKGKDWIYDKLESEAELVSLKPVATILPPKKFLLPHGEKIFSQIENKIDFSPSSIKPTVIFAINSFDIHALMILDQVMSRPNADSYYLERRKNTILIGAGPERINIANSGYDLFLEEFEESFLAIPGSITGSGLLELPFFEKTKLKPKKILSFKDPILSQTDKIKSAIESSYKGKIWEHVANTCFGCGNCVYVCPLCYCNEFEDNPCGNNCAEREKHWDACFLPDFFKVAGHNFRENLPERIYNWYHHKFVRFPEEYGHIGCIDCGRCIEYCPAKINFKEVLKELIKVNNG